MTTDLEHRGSTAEPSPDPAAVEAFAERVFGYYTGGMVTYMIDVGHRTGLLDRLAEAPASSDELAARGGASERYVREWLAALTAAGVVSYDPRTVRYELPTEHAVCLTGGGALNLAPQSQITSLLATYVPDVARAFTEGGGVPFEAYRPAFTNVMDGLSRGVLDSTLMEGILPCASPLPERMLHGIRVADVGCGTGHSTNLMARHYPASRFVGYDIATHALDRAREEAAGWALGNVSFDARDARELPVDPPFDAVFAFDVIHDLVDPAGVLRRIHDALAPGGVFVMYDVDAASSLEDNLDHPLAPFIYSVSTLHCLTVSLSEDGAGLGTAWGRDRATGLLGDAGFAEIGVHDLPDDPLNCLYVASKATR
ncbi:methyltransferase domain-containing protein [Egibacter rhizosphaerae]|uniref:Methyltransferase domain-containing protein n=1 Tax=Egibacter rhizosphaerae TaxID=1670831 RepID=A0A411YFV7_9ACTN|nr:class I SAM-dependent methyltransferase [Egibacter rhizosphaerae]QBI20059.1 methyltransferase domain-containing protein [Egibacter rhizosphaerae]